MAVTRVRVELKNKYNDPHKNFKLMMQEFRTQVSDAGILHDYKEKSTFESPGEKKRRKRAEQNRKFRNERLEKLILLGERVKAPAGLIKKVMAKHRKKNYKSDQ